MLNNVNEPFWKQKGVTTYSCNHLGGEGVRHVFKLLSEQIQKEKIHLGNILNKGWLGFGGYSIKLCLESGDSREPREEQEVEELGREDLSSGTVNVIVLLLLSLSN